MKMKNMMFALVLSAAVAGLASAHGGGMGGGAQGQMGGAGMLTVADDGSLLVTEMSSMMGGDDRAIVNIAPDGGERWRATFDDGWPMMPVNDGDLVVLALREDWWSGWDGTGDAGGPGGGHGGGPGGGHGGGPGGGHGGGGGGGPHADNAVLVGLDLTTGAELWRTEIAGGMVAAPRFAPDGSRFYVTVRDFDETAGGLCSGPMHQGGSPGGFQLMSTSLVAVDRNGTVLWTVELSQGGQKRGGVR